MRSVESAIEQHYTDVRRYARALARNGADPEELIQDCMIRALSRPDIWNEVRDPRAYLLSILHNTYVDAMASRHRHRQLFCADDAEFAESRPASQLASLELQDVARGMRRLPREQRSTLTCIGIDGMTYQETAERLGVPLGTVMSRLSRARGALRDMLEG